MAPTPAPKPAAAGKPGGLPIWAWGAAAALGLVIGLLVFRKDSAAAAETSSAGRAAADEAATGGVQGQPLPPELLAALGLRSGEVSSSDSSASTSSDASFSTATTAASEQDTISSASFDSLRAQGTNQQLPPHLRIPGLPPDAPVISSYFGQAQTISGPNQAQTIHGPGSTPAIATVTQPTQPPRLAPALPGGGKVYAV